MEVSTVARRARGWKGRGNAVVEGMEMVRRRAESADVLSEFSIVEVSLYSLFSNSRWMLADDRFLESSRGFDVL